MLIPSTHFAHVNTGASHKQASAACNESSSIRKGAAIQLYSGADVHVIATALWTRQKLLAMAAYQAALARSRCFVSARHSYHSLPVRVAQAVRTVSVGWRLGMVGGKASTCVRRRTSPPCPVCTHPVPRGSR